MKKAFKKIMAMGLATLLGIGTMNMMMVSADNTALNTELLVNGEFSLEDEDGAVLGWTLTKPSGSGGSIKVENEVLRINASHGTVEGGNLDVSKSLYAINRWDYAKPTNGTTVISGRIYIESMQEGSSVVIDSNRKGFGAANTMGATITYTEATNGWETFESSITDTTASTDGYMFYVRVYGTALVWVDDISIQHKERLLVSPMENMVWSQYNASRNVDFGYISNENYAGAQITPYSGDDCFYQWIVADSDRTPRPYTALAGSPVIGANYRITMRFKPLTDEATYLGPRMEIVYLDTVTGGTNLVKLNFDCWTVENVTTDNWKEISAYFTMPDYDTEKSLALKIWAYYGGWIDDLMIERDYDEPVKIVSANFEEIEKAAPGASIKLNSHIVSDKTADQGGRKVNLILARYAKNGDKMQCVDVQVLNKTVNSGVAMTGTDGNSAYTTAAEEIIYDYMIPSDAEGQVIKAFLWDGANTLEPVGKADTITVSAS